MGVEEKYYGDGEDAFVMKKQLMKGSQMIALEKFIQ